MWSVIVDCCAESGKKHMRIGENSMAPCVIGERAAEMLKIAHRA
jgi:hypothetical protein